MDSKYVFITQTLGKGIFRSGKEVSWKFLVNSPDHNCFTRASLNVQALHAAVRDKVILSLGMFLSTLSQPLNVHP